MRLLSREFFFKSMPIRPRPLASVVPTTRPSSLLNSAPSTSLSSAVLTRTSTSKKLSLDSAVFVVVVDVGVSFGAATVVVAEAFSPSGRTNFTDLAPR